LLAAMGSDEVGRKEKKTGLTCAYAKGRKTPAGGRGGGKRHGEKKRKKGPDLSGAPEREWIDFRAWLLLPEKRKGGKREKAVGGHAVLLRPGKKNGLRKVCQQKKKRKSECPLFAGHGDFRYILEEEGGRLKKGLPDGKGKGGKSHLLLHEEKKRSIKKSPLSFRRKLGRTKKEGKKSSIPHTHDPCSKEKKKKGG